MYAKNVWRNEMSINTKQIIVHNNTAYTIPKYIEIDGKKYKIPIYDEDLNCVN